MWTSIFFGGIFSEYSTNVDSYQSQVTYKYVRQQVGTKVITLAIHIKNRTSKRYSQCCFHISNVSCKQLHIITHLNKYTESLYSNNT